MESLRHVRLVGRAPDDHAHQHRFWYANRDLSLDIDIAAFQHSDESIVAGRDCQALQYCDKDTASQFDLDAVPHTDESPVPDCDLDAVPHTDEDTAVHCNFGTFQYPDQDICSERDAETISDADSKAFKQPYHDSSSERDIHTIPCADQDGYTEAVQYTHQNFGPDRHRLEYTDENADAIKDTDQDLDAGRKPDSVPYPDQALDSHHYANPASYTFTDARVR